MFSKQKNVTLEISLDDDFNGIMYGLPEESYGCKLKGKVILKNKNSLPVKHLLFVFLGKTSVSCGPPMSSNRPEFSESQTIFRKQCVFHKSETTNRKIHAGTHEYFFEFDLPGNLPSSFQGSRGKIEYSCSAILARPLFRNDILVKKPIYIKRCLMDEMLSHNSTFTEGVLDGRISYQINTPIIAYREGGLVQTELTLKHMNSDTVIEAVEYGLKERIHYHTTGEQDLTILADVDEDRYPLGKKKVPIDSFFHAGSDPIRINFRLCPWVSSDIDSPLINVHHKLTYNICVTETISAETENASSVNASTITSSAQGSRRYSVPTSTRNLERGEGRRRTYRNSSLLPNNRNSRTFSIKTILNNSSQNKIVKSHLHFEIPIIITTKSCKPRQQAPLYTSIDQPPDYVIASMIPPPPEYEDAYESIEEDVSDDEYEM
ncbi:11487_t:CDS:2, partial [Funneliformis mosseae]